MKLQNVITFRLSLLKAGAIALWAVLFYFAIVEEINDETDDTLTSYAETLITKYLAGEPMPKSYMEAANQYYMRSVSDDYAARTPHVKYSDKEVYVESEGEYEPARSISYIFQTDGGGYRELVVFTPSIDKSDLKEAIFGWLLALYIVLLLGIVAVNFWTVRHSMKPLYALLRWLDSYRIGRNNEPLKNETNISEFRKLNEAVIQSTLRNEQLYDQQRRFIANASHEIQTPIAVCQSRLEMMLDEENLTEGQMGEIIKTLRTLKELSDMNRSLLTLCKIDNGQFADIAEIRLGEVAQGILDDLGRVYARKGITVDCDLRESPVWPMSKSLASMLLSNLIKNAFVHNVEDGKVELRSTGGSLTISNTGAASPLDHDKIFERFYHSGVKSSSTGLGLAIVEAICRLYGISISYSFAGGMHRFELSKG